MVTSYSHRLAGYLRQSVDFDVVDDLLQETFIQAFQHWEKLKTPDSPMPWLLTIARSQVLNHYRSQKTLKRSAPPTPLDKPPPPPDPHAALVAKQRSQSIRDCIQALPAQMRAVISLQTYQDATLEEIAGRLDMRLGSVKSQLFRARQKLQPCIETALGGGA